jgi:hypothetical protein
VAFLRWQFFGWKPKAHRRRLHSKPWKRELD